MQKKYKLQSKVSGFWFVKGQGYISSLEAASALTVNEIEAIRAAGFEPFKAIEVVTSFAVSYVRVPDLNDDGSIKDNVKNPSRRRFATRDEAIQHGSRFSVRKAKGSDVEGSAGHIGYYVIETSDPVNATINWKTGLTNALV
jgi:hypothetical protein